MIATKTFIRKHYLITLPMEVRKSVPIEVGDPVEIVVSDEGEILIRPLKAIDASQAWFWTKTHQKAEQEAESELKAGKAKPAKSARHLIYELNKK